MVRMRPLDEAEFDLLAYIEQEAPLHIGGDPRRTSHQLPLEASCPITASTRWAGATPGTFTATASSQVAVDLLASHQN